MLLTCTLARFRLFRGRRRHLLLLSVDSQLLEFLSTPPVLQGDVILLPRLARLYLHFSPPSHAQGLHCPR